MKCFAGLDVSIKETSVCVVDETGKVCREAKIPTHPTDLAALLNGQDWEIELVGLEAGPMSQWLFRKLADLGLPVVCIEVRHARAFLKSRINKNDRNDARGIAQMMRVNLFRPVHVKTIESQRQRALLTARTLLQDKALAIENDVRGLLRNFGLRVGVIGGSGFEERARGLAVTVEGLIEIISPLLESRRTLRDQTAVLHRLLLAIVRSDDVCRRLMTVPGVGPVVSLAFRATIDVPARFKHSRAVGAALGLTPSQYQSGETDRVGRISRRGDAMMRVLLYGAAQVMLTRTKNWSWLKAWAMRVAQRRGMKRAIVALARRLATVMHRLWVDGTEFRWTKEIETA